jgi:molybdate/tungstate transport system substrate-binding protein
MMTGHRTRWFGSIVAATLLAVSARVASGQGADTVVLFDAGSLARPFKAALDTFATRTHAVVFQENAGSLETARKLTDLGRIPDVVALADYEVFPQLLMPDATRWYAVFARNRMVIAYTDRSKAAREISSQNWWHVLTRPDVEVGRADPNLDPAGYRTLLVYQLAEREYAHPGLAAALLAASPARNVRPKSADLTALLQTGELDYAWGYESVAQGANLRYVRLPERIDLSTPADSAFYAQATVRVLGKTPADTIELHGAPILYALSIPTKAPHPVAAQRFVTFLLSESGRRILRANNLEVLNTPTVVGTGAPATVTGGGGKEGGLKPAPTTPAITP